MKLGLHTIGDPNLDALRRVRGPVAKVYDWDSPDTIREVQKIVPLVVYRHVYNVAENVEVKYDNETPDAFFARLPRKLFGLGLIWEGPNEPIIETVEQAKALNAWFVKFGNLMHAAGEQVIAFSFPTGCPPLHLVPYLRDAAKACKRVGLHEYADLKNGEVMLGRYRDFIAALGFVVQIVITEAGFDIDGSPNGGWNGKD